MTPQTAYMIAEGCQIDRNTDAEQRSLIQRRIYAHGELERIEAIKALAEMFLRSQEIARAASRRARGR